MSLNDFKLKTDEDVATYYKSLGYKYYPTKLKQQREFNLDKEIKIQEILDKLKNGIIRDTGTLEIALNALDLNDLENKINSINLIKDNVDKLNQLRMLLTVLDKDLGDYLVKF